MKSSLAAVAAALGSASALKCHNLTVPVDISARNGVFNVSAPQNNIEVTNFILNLSQQGSNYSAATLEGYATVRGHYNLAATYCEPDECGEKKPKVVQLLTHGIGFDRNYWNYALNNYNYSYSAVAVEKYGYATFAWDRLGIGMSSHGDPVQEIQALLEVAALRALTEGLRAGNITSVPKFKKVVHVGHSFGSEHTYALTAQDPTISDGIALTGFSQNGSFVPFFELGGNFVDIKTIPALAPKYVHGYLGAGDASGVQTNFFSPGMFSAEVLDYATNVVGQPVTIGELLTIGGETGSPNKFAGPVLVVTGERDVPYCGGSCSNGAPKGSSIPEVSAQKTFVKTNISTVIVPGAGHGLNLEYSHPFTYKSVNDFFVSKGLKP